MNLRERMGSGGPRGLQILRSGASGVRGGFDSHAFPPAFATPALALALLLAPAPARAQAPASPDSLARRVGVQVVGGGRARTAASAAADSTRRRSWTRQPRFVMARSLILPGWGQFYNHAWLKAAAVAGGEGWLGAGVIEDQRRLDDILRELDRARQDIDREREATLVNQYNDQLDQRLARQWILGAVVAYALVDAYVDAHFRGFDLEFQHDPALPAGTPSGSASSPGTGAGVRSALPLAGGGVRLGLRWTF